MKASLYSLRIAPRKVRRVADLIRNKSVREATALLTFTKEKAAHDIAKLLKSAATNAKNTIGKDATDLFVSSITVDPGPVFKRYQTKWRGMASTIRKKTSHIKIALGERDRK